MDERWRSVKELFQAAAEQPAGERDAFLDAAPGADDDMRRDVRSLLRADVTDSIFDRLPLAGAAALADIPPRTALAAGIQIGPYAIDRLIGSGSMGEVYRARDTRLKRDVALKILPADLARDLDRLARFRREAQVLATLNHPNIAQIYGLEGRDPSTGSGQVGQEWRDGRPVALVLEFIDGPTLAERMASKRLSLPEALGFARQIADALAAAHEKGIVHRDLKPANIAIDRAGTVKVLDFGLAKMSTAADGSLPSPDLTPTDVQGRTVLGTPTYMSPEQARGRPLDRRADLWSFGCLLFEMLTSRPPFARESIAETLAAVLEHDVDYSVLPADTPASVRRLLRRCLEKDPARRLDSAAVARLELDDAIKSEPEAARHRAVAWPVATSRGAVVALALLALVILSAVVWFPLVRPGSGGRAQTARFAIVTPADAPLNLFGPTRDLAFSPDGRLLAYRSGGTQTAGSELMIRSIDRLEAVRVQDATGVYSPFFSPDGQWVAFLSPSEIKKIAVSGGPAITVCEFRGTPRGASWGAGNTITFAVNGPAGGLWRVSADGGKAERLLPADSDGRTGYAFPSVLPGGRAVLFTIQHSGSASTEVAVVDLRTGAQKTLIPAASDAEYVESGHLVFASGGSLRAVRFDAGRLEVVGESVLLSESVFVKSGGASDYALTRGGALAYVTAEAGTPAPRALVWVDRKGREEPLDMPQRLYGAPRISPDGTSVAISILDNGSAEVWAFDLPGGPLKRLTFSPHTNGVGNWTPDGRQIVFSMYDENGVLNLYRVSATGTGRYEPIAPGSRHRWGSSVTRDGKGLFAFDQTPQGHNRVLLLPITSESQSQSPDKVLFEGNFSDVSPDGRYIAYQSVETGPSEVFVRAFPDVRNGPWQISTAGGAHPVWSRDGRELFFKDAANALNVVRVDTSGLTLVSGPPVKVFDTPYYEPNPQRWYDVSPDGRRFLMIKESTPPRSATPASMVVVQNWADELKARLSR